MKLTTTIVKILRILLVLVFTGWLIRVYSTSGTYLKEALIVRYGGLPAEGTIHSVRANPEIETPGSYLARVSYTAIGGTIFRREFRYGSEKLDPAAPKITVYYSETTPLYAALKEDGGTFRQTIGFIIVFTGLFLVLFLCLSHLNRRFKEAASLP